MPHLEPPEWKEQRARWTWGMLLLSAVVSLLTQWLAQIVGGAVAGAVVGDAKMLAVASNAETLGNINSVSLWLFIIITVVVVFVVTRHTFDNLTWYASGWGQEWGINWWKAFWKPVLIAAVVHGALFGIVLRMYADAPVLN